MQRTLPSTTPIAALIALTLASLTSTAATAQEVTYVVEPTHSFVYFEVVHYKTSTVRGRFDKTEGTIKVNREARTGSADITVHTTAINTGIPAFDGMLKSDKFFDAANHPQAQFKATEFTFGSDASVQAVQMALQQPAASIAAQVLRASAAAAVLERTGWVPGSQIHDEMAFVDRHVVSWCLMWRNE